MVVQEIKNISSDKSDLRKFGLTIGIASGLLAGLFLWRQRDYYLYFLIFSLACISIAFVWPVLLKPFQKTWMTLAILLGWVVTRIILIVLFYLVVTPTGILMRLLGKNPLDLKFSDRTDSYWIPKKQLDFERKNYERQF